MGFVNIAVQRLAGWNVHTFTAEGNGQLGGIQTMPVLCAFRAIDTLGKILTGTLPSLQQGLVLIGLRS